MKVESFYNKKEKKQQYRCRFQFNRKEFYLSADTKKELNDLVEEVRVQERRAKSNLPTIETSPLLADLFERRKKQILRHSEKTIAARVFGVFLDLLPPEIEVTQLRQAHVQLYIDKRLREVKPQTVNREICTIASAVHKADKFYPELENWRVPKIPKAAFKKQRRTRIITDEERASLLDYLRRPKVHAELVIHYRHRLRLADILEFSLHTGLRRKELTWLKWTNYKASERALRLVKRWKTGTVTPFFPLTARAAEIIENRRDVQKDSEFIFSPDGKPIESNYRTLKKVCAELSIPYGHNLEDGFVMHDSRHNFTTDILQVTDVETARMLTAHRGEDLLTYAHTNEKRMRTAIRRFEGAGLFDKLLEVYTLTKNGELDFENFSEQIKKMLDFSARSG